MPILLGESEDPQLDAEAAAIGEAGGRLGQSCEGGGKRRIFAIGGFGQRLLPEWERVIVKTCTPSRVVNTVHLIQSQKKTEPAPTGACIKVNYYSKTVDSLSIS